MASTRLRVSHGGLGSRPAKNMLYSASSWLDRRLEALHVAFDFADGRHGVISAWKQEPHEREPQLARVGHGPIVNQHFGLIRRPDDFEQFAQAGRIASTRSALDTSDSLPCRSPGTRPNPAPVRAPGKIAGGRAGNTSVIENGRAWLPKSASCRSGSIAASSSSVGCSGSSAYGQKRSSGR